MIVLFYEKYFKDNLLHLKIGIFQKRFNNTRTKLLITIKLKILRNNFSQLHINLWILAINNLTDNIISKLIINKLLDILHNLINHSLLKLKVSSPHANLHHTTPLFVFCYENCILFNGVVDWLFVRVTNEYFKASLYHMVPMDVYR